MTWTMMDRFDGFDLSLWLKMGIMAFSVMLGPVAQAQTVHIGSLLDYYLHGSDAVCASPDGLHVFAASAYDDRIGVFSREPITGDLTFVTAFINGQGGVDGLDGVTSIAVSPEGNHAIASGANDDSVVVFSRDAETWSFQEIHRDGVDGIDGLDAARGVAISPDGLHVYVVGKFDNALVIFSRDPSSGTLTHVDTLFDDTSGINGLRGATELAISPDGSTLCATGSSEDAVSVFSRDPSSGELTFVECHIDGQAGVSGLAGVTGVSYSPDGQNVYFIGYRTVAVFQIHPSSGGLVFLEFHQNNVNGVEHMPSPSDVEVSVDGNNLFVVSYALNYYTIVRFSRNPSTGLLQYQELVETGDLIAKEICLSPDGVHIYASHNDSNSNEGLHLFDYDNVSGLPVFRKTCPFTYCPGTEGGNEVVVSPDGRFCHIAGRHDDSLVVFSLTPVSGMPACVETYTNGVAGIEGIDSISSMTISADGEFLYATGPGDHSVVQFSRDIQSGLLTFEQRYQDGQDGIEGLYFVETADISPDGSQLLTLGNVSSGNDTAIASFDRNVQTGDLTFAGVFQQGIENINSCVDLAFSPDGAHVYVATGSQYDGGVVHVFRDEGGQMIFEHFYRNEQQGLYGLAGARNLMVSGDGRNLYVACVYSESLVVFTRDQATGVLTLLEVVFPNTYTYDVAVNPSDSRIYVATLNRLAIFDRDPTNGSITSISSHRAPGLEYMRSLSLDPSAQHAYVSGENSLVTFLNWGEFLPAWPIGISVLDLIPVTAYLNQD